MSPSHRHGLFLPIHRYVFDDLRYKHARLVAVCAWLLMHLTKNIAPSVLCSQCWYVRTNLHRFTQHGAFTLTLVEIGCNMLQTGLAALGIERASA